MVMMTATVMVIQQLECLRLVLVLVMVILMLVILVLVILVLVLVLVLVLALVLVLVLVLVLQRFQHETKTVRRFLSWYTNQFPNYKTTPS